MPAVLTPSNLQQNGDLPRRSTWGRLFNLFQPTLVSYVPKGCLHPAIKVRSHNGPRMFTAMMSLFICSPRGGARSNTEEAPCWHYAHLSLGYLGAVRNVRRTAVWRDLSSSARDCGEDARSCSTANARPRSGVPAYPAWTLFAR